MLRKKDLFRVKRKLFHADVTPEALIEWVEAQGIDPTGMREFFEEGDNPEAEGWGFLLGVAAHIEATKKAPTPRRK